MYRFRRPAPGERAPNTSSWVIKIFRRRFHHGKALLLIKPCPNPAQPRLHLRCQIVRLRAERQPGGHRADTSVRQPHDRLPAEPRHLVQQTERRFHAGRRHPNAHLQQRRIGRRRPPHLLPLPHRQQRLAAQGGGFHGSMRRTNCLALGNLTLHRFVRAVHVHQQRRLPRLQTNRQGIRPPRRRNQRDGGWQQRRGAHRSCRGHALRQGRKRGNQQAFLLRQHRQAKRHFRHHAECAQRANVQLAHVVAGDIFHHPPAVAQQLSPSGSATRMPSNRSRIPP